MKAIELFTMALGLSKLCLVTRVESVTGDDSIKELRLWIEFIHGHKFSIDGSTSSIAYDTLNKTWHHLNFFQHRCYLHVQISRFCIDGHGIVMVEVQWVRKNSGLALMDKYRVWAVNVFSNTYRMALGRICAHSGRNDNMYTMYEE